MGTSETARVAPPQGGEAHDRRLSSATRWCVVVLIHMLGVGLIWTGVTPLGGVPDEPAHVAYAASVVRLDLGTLEEVPSPPPPGRTAGSPRRGPGDFRHLIFVDIPAWIASVDVCYAVDELQTADCAGPVSEVRELESLPTGATLYPPPYYFLVGLPTLLLSGSGALYAMRLISVLVFCGLLGLGVAVASPHRRPWLALGAVLAATPMVGHLYGSVNPSAMEIGAALGLVVALLGIENAMRPQTAQAVMVAVLLALLGWARPLSFLTLGAVVAAGLLLNGRAIVGWLKRETRHLAVVGVGLVVGLGSVLYELSVRVPTTRIAAAGASSGYVGEHVGLVANIRSIETLFVSWAYDMVGRFGWLDHRPPDLILMGWVLVAGAVVIGALVVAGRRDRWALLTVSLGALVLAPLAVLQFAFGSARAYQARYHLPLALLVVVGAVFTLSKHAEEHPDGSPVGAGGSRFLFPVLPFAAVAILISAASSLWRYGVGGPSLISDLVTLRFLRDAAWLPSSGAMLWVIAGVVAMVSASVWGIRLGRSSDDRAGMETAEEAELAI